MSVNVEDREESRVEFLEVARQISKRSAQMVANGPHKYLATYGDHLMRCSLQLYTNADIANSIYVTSKQDAQLREQHFKIARGYAFSIESVAKLYTDLIVEAGTVEKEKAHGRAADLARLCCKERGLLKGVIQSDKKRYHFD